MQDVNHFLETDGVDRAVGVAVMALDQFDHTRTAKALQDFHAGVPFADLRLIDRETHRILNVVRKGAEILFARSHPCDWFGGLVHHAKL